MATAVTTISMASSTKHLSNQEESKKDTHLTELEHVMNDSNVEAYHTIASKAKLSALKEGDKSTQSLFQYLISSNTTAGSCGGASGGAAVKKAKTGLLRELMRSGGDTTTRGFQLALEQLLVWSSLHEFDANIVVPDDDLAPPKLEGTWITLSKPQFSDCQGVNENNDFMYTLGRMSFGTSTSTPCRYSMTVTN